MSLLAAGFDKLLCYTVQEKKLSYRSSVRQLIARNLSTDLRVLRNWGKAFMACTATTFAFNLQMKKMQQDCVHSARLQRKWQNEYNEIQTL